MTRSTPGIRRGAVWSLGGAVILRLTTFVTGIVVARLVAPDQVGILVMALTVQLVVVSASELGIATAVARHQGSVAEIGPTATALSLGSSAVLALLMVALAPVIARLLGADSAAPVVAIMSLTVILAGMTSVSVGLLMREFRQRSRVIAEASGLVAGLALVPIFAGSGAAGLAWTRVIGQAVSAVLLLVVAPARWWPRLDLQVARRLIIFGLPLVVGTALGFATLNIDVVILGAVSGAAALGFYSLAFNVSQWPLALVTGTVNAVGLPAFAQAMADRRYLACRLQHVTQAAAAVAIPLGMLTGALAIPLVAVLYGTAWAASAPIVIFLSCLALIRVPLDVLGSVLVASGRSRTYLALQALQFGVSIPALLIGVAMAGPIGAALSQIVVAVLVVAPSYVYVLTRYLTLDLTPVIRPLLRNTVVGLVAAGAAWTSSRGLSNPVAHLVVGGAVGLLIYVVLLRLVCRETTDLLMSRVPRVVTGTA